MRSTRPLAGLALVIALALAGCAGTPPAGPTATPAAEPVETTPAGGEPSVPPPGPVPPAPDKRDLSIRIAAVGDIMLGTDYPENHLPDDDGIGFLAGVAPVLAAADLAFGNLEGVLADGGEPVKACNNPNACYLFRSPTRYAEHLVNAGFDLISLANNHALDFGEAGRDSSMAALDRVGIRHSGREGTFASFEHGELRVALLAFAVTRNSNLVFDYDLVETTVSEFAAAHDIVIVSFHGGAEGRGFTRLPFAEEEYYGEPRGDVVRFARLAVDAGADLVVGHGPHVIRAAERYRDRLIAYSLGNFATYYGISVAGIKGVAPILDVTLDGEGRFLGGRIVSTHQLRPAGPTIDPEAQALQLLRSLSRQDFGNPGLEFHDDGRLEAVPRPWVKPHPAADVQPSSVPTDLKSTPSERSLR
ncbi:MAG: CapA family protein [Woeseiaceae bacterium]|nr:CapA family protein [Woeseiaceae bacterium]